MYIKRCTYPKRVYICFINNKPTMTHKEFADKVYSETKSQSETMYALLCEFIELSEKEAEAIAIEAFEDAKDAKQYKGEQQSDLNRGN